MKYMLSIFLLVSFLWAIERNESFAMSKKLPDAISEKPKTPTPAPIVVPAKAPLSWEKNHPERKKWSEFVFEFLDAEMIEAFDLAKDARRICPKYEILSKEQRISVWGELISAVAYYESGWNPASRMVETTMGIDPVTKKQVASEGLLQLSYQDVPNYGSILKFPLCRIEWQKDKGLDVKDVKKTIFDPFVNLECGIRIMANQIKKKSYVILESGVYWAVLHDGGKYSKVSAILGMVKQTGLCH